MADKDVTEKVLEAYNDVFADIVNVLLFHGKQVISPDELEDQTPRSYYKADGKIREIERDVAKRWTKGDIRLAFIGFENQTVPDLDMPLRIMGYDGAAYRAQLLQDSRDSGASASRYPVVTLVLYFGHKKHWDRPLSLKDRLDIPPEFAEYVSDYKINLFEIAYLSMEQVRMFQSDFRVVEEYFVQMRENNGDDNYTPERVKIQHVQETMQLLSVMTHDRRLEEFYNENREELEGGPVYMCEYLDKMISKGRQEGRLEGRQEGELEKSQEVAAFLRSKGMTFEFIAEAVKTDVDQVKKWLH